MNTSKVKFAEKLKPISLPKEVPKLLVSPLKKLPPVSLREQPQPSTSNERVQKEFNRLIRGDFSEDFSKQSSRLFRIFLSSTFSDFKVERNELYRRVFPSIKQRCAQLGYEFQVVDMR